MHVDDHLEAKALATQGENAVGQTFNFGSLEIHLFMLGVSGVLVTQGDVIMVEGEQIRCGGNRRLKWSEKPVISRSSYPVS